VILGKGGRAFSRSPPLSHVLSIAASRFAMNATQSIPQAAGLQQLKSNMV
jgi:hypothetical protein